MIKFKYQRYSAQLGEILLIKMLSGALESGV